MRKVNVYIIFLIVLSLTFLGFKKKNQEYSKHFIKVSHPGISQKDSINCVLFETKESLLSEKKFFMDVETVVCGDKQCKIDIIRVYWDKFGDYLKFDLLNGVQLEKADGLHFTKTDYTKLQNILKDAISPLKNAYKNEIVSNSSGEGFDAISGETILLEKSAYVKGAVWTCYTLWHWANGNIKNAIRNITGKKYSNIEITKFLNSYKKSHQSFALEQLTRKKDFSEPSVKAVKRFLLKNPESTKNGIEYFQKSNIQKSSSTIIELFQKSNLRNRLLYLKLIKANSHNFESNQFVQVFNTINRKPFFEELTIFLDVLEENKSQTSLFISDLFQLLNQKNILISRRVFWFLKNKKLTDIEKITLDKYYLKHKDRL